MSKIRFGVIGCGYIAKKAFLPAIKKSKTAELIAIASRDLKKSKLEAKNNNCDFENNDMRKKILNTLKEMRAYDRPNVFEVIKNDIDKGE